jgi:hypothetical protein
MDVVEQATGYSPMIPNRLKATLLAPEKVNVLPNNFSVIRDFIVSKSSK